MNKSEVVIRIPGADYDFVRWLQQIATSTQYTPLTLTEVKCSYSETWILETNMPEYTDVTVTLVAS